MLFSNLESNIFFHVKKASLVFGICSAFGYAEIIGHITFRDMNRIPERWSIVGLLFEENISGMISRRGDIAYF